MFCAAAVVATFVAPVAAHANHGCNGNITDIGGVLYIDDRGADSGNVWVYAESNGQAGLQAGGTQAVFGYTDACPNDIDGPSDTLIY